MEPRKSFKRLALPCNTRLFALLRGITSENNGDSYCLNCLYSFRTENKLPSQKDNILKIDQYLKSDKTPCIIYVDLEYLMDVQTIQNNLQQQI